MKLDKKGMTMAIQIFIVLFVLLAVALLVLRLVTEQSEQQIKIISEEMRQQQLKKIKADCTAKCKCDTIRDKVGYCLSLINNEGTPSLNLDEDGFPDDFVEPPETAGLYGLCEDRVYCSQISTCKCGNQELTMKNCFSLICQLWESEGADTLTLMDRFFPPPICDMTEEQQVRHWSFVYALEMSCGA